MAWTTKKETTTKARDVYQEVTDKIVAALEAGTVPWVKPWSTYATGSSQPQNAVTGRPYSGTNVILLWLEQQAKGYSTGRWLTFNQCREFGGSVKGQKATMITKWGTFNKKNKDTGEDETRMFLKVHHVFNLDQCAGLPDALLHLKCNAKPRPNQDERNAIADKFIGATLADIRHGSSRACYHPREDYIELPAYEAFHSADAYYNTAFHELAHWTGADKPNRLNRDKTGSRFGNAAYAREELVAELAAAFLNCEHGMDGALQSAAYIASWIQLLKDDSKAFVQAAAAAQKAADCLKNFSRPTTAAEDETAPVAFLEAA